MVIILCPLIQMSFPTMTIIATGLTGTAGQHALGKFLDWDMTLRLGKEREVHLIASVIACAGAGSFFVVIQKTWPLVLCPGIFHR